MIRVQGRTFAEWSGVDLVSLKFETDSFGNRSFGKGRPSSERPPEVEPNAVLYVTRRHRLADVCGEAGSCRPRRASGEQNHQHGDSIMRRPTQRPVGNPLLCEETAEQRASGVWPMPKRDRRGRTALHPVGVTACRTAMT